MIVSAKRTKSYFGVLYNSYVDQKVVSWFSE